MANPVSGGPNRREWERFATEDPYFYVCTDTPGAATAEEREAFFRRGTVAADELLREVEADLPGWSTVVEIGCGVGRLLLPTARRFAEARGVDVAPTMLEMLAANARDQGVVNVRGYLPEAGWGDPPARADYVFSFLVFQHIEDKATIVRYIARAAAALRPGGVTQFQFDTRAPSPWTRVRALLPGSLLPRTQRRGIRRVRRDPAWVRGVLRSAGLELLRERDPDTSLHRFMARKPTGA
jgi:SAM-dependent methyltransferase